MAARRQAALISKYHCARVLQQILQIERATICIAGERNGLKGKNKKIKGKGKGVWTEAHAPLTRSKKDPSSMVHMDDTSAAAASHSHNKKTAAESDDSCLS